MFYELMPRYDTRQSFYKKAIVEEKEFKTRKSTQYNLYSYNTLVAMVNKYENKIVYNYFGKYSQTTTRHQKEFFKQFDLSDKEIKELFKNGKLQKEVL